MSELTFNPTSSQQEQRECRCICGLLIAKITSNGLEVKCRHCKRTHVMRLHPKAFPVFEIKEHIQDYSKGREHE